MLITLKTNLRASLSVVFLLFAGSTQAKPLTKMQMIQHASPLPNLMMLINMNIKSLDLNNEQIEVIKGWGKTNKERSQKLIKRILEAEKKLKYSVLEGIKQSELNEQKQQLLALRGELIDLKYLCNSTMKKTLTKEQWSQLIEIRKTKLAIVASDKEASNEVQAFLRVSPMPKLMLMVIMHKKELALTKEQSEALEVWRLKNMSHWSLLFSAVLKNEKQITQQALAMKSNNSLMKQFDEMTKKRREMAQMSLNCRDNMEKILSKKQWEIMVKLLKDYL